MGALNLEPDTEVCFLVVDDDRESLEMIREYLQVLGYQKIVVAPDGASGLRQLEANPQINFIISDWDMPGLTGMDFLERVRRDPEKKEIPFLMVTAPVSQEKQKISKAAERMVDGYLIKPFRLDALESKINDIKELFVHGSQQEVLVVDDDPDAQQMVIEYLKHFGFKKLRSFSDGKQAFLYLASHAERVGLVISDWDMPHMSGIELLRGCRQHKDLKELPFLMMTSQVSQEQKKILRAAKERVSHYLLKPFTADELQKRIQQVYSTKRARSDVAPLQEEGLEHLKRGRYERAVSVFQALTEKAPDQDFAWRLLGQSVSLTKGAVKALDHYQKALECNPMNPDNYIYLALNFEKIGQIEKGVETLERAIYQLGSSLDLHLHCAKLYYRSSRLKRCRDHLNRVMDMSPFHEEAQEIRELIIDSS